MPIRRDPRRLGASVVQPGALGRNGAGFAAQGIQLVAECGPGKVLAGLNKRIVDGLPV
jgi:malonyl CoA-acyl carrier protein transacylase